MGVVFVRVRRVNQPSGPVGVVFVRVRRVNQPSGPVGVVFVRVSGVKAHSLEKQPCGCVKSVRG